ncbi:Rv0361 family membrane protein [Agromyces atrinae]|nr:hypothetical protein [Agromyces atrinae]
MTSLTGRQRTAIGVVVVLAVLLAAAVIVAISLIASLSSERPSPVPLAERYVTALANGDATEAARLDGHDSADEPFLSDDALGSAERITEASVEGYQYAGDAATATVRFTLDGEQHTAEIGFVWQDDAWVIDEGLASAFSVTGGVQSPSDYALPFEIGGVVAPDESGEPVFGLDRTYLVYPGVYDVDLLIDPATIVDITVDPALASDTTGEPVRFTALPGAAETRMIVRLTEPPVSDTEGTS